MPEPVADLVRVLLGQLAPRPGDVAGNVQLVVDAIDAHPEADLAVFPELFLSGYDLTQVASLALEPSDGVLDPLRAAAKARRVAVLLGFPERLPSGVGNSVGCVDVDGEWVANYRKTHLFGPEERDAFRAGDALLLVDLGVRLAPLVCFDMEFPEPARAVSRAGAELLVTVAANMHPYGRDHALAARARALDNRRPHVYVNRVGAEQGLEFAGGSLVVDAAGEVVAELGAEAEMACVDLPAPTAPAEDVDYLRLLRPELLVREHLVTTAAGGGQ